MDVADRVIAILADQALLRPEDLDRSMTLSEIGLDSLALAETLFALEEAFDIHVPFNANGPEAGGADLSTVGSVIAAVEGLVGARA
jgi:acyl carrier protein